jgi:hypothetical protein
VDGRRPQPKRIEQLKNWPEPVDQSAVNSFLCFVNYLREYLPSDWVKHEQVLRPFRKKGCEFEKLWTSDTKYKEAFLKIREMMSESVVIRHVDHVAAARPHESGRPFEMFIDASDYGWAAVLCQRPEPGKAPVIIAVIAKGFTDVQQRWSAMERDVRLVARRGWT